MKKLFLTLICLSTLNSVLSQTINRPLINSQDSNKFTIDKIENKDNNTIVSFTYTSSDEYINGGWVRINPNIVIKETNSERTYKLIKSEGMPLSPSKHEFSFNGQKLRFKLYFPKIDRSLKKIDIIESQENENFFNFYEISLDNRNVNNEETIYLSDKYVNYLPKEIKNIFTSLDFVLSEKVSLISYTNGLIEKLEKEKSKNIVEITVDENEKSQSYTFELNSKVNPIIEFYFNHDSKLKGGIDFTRFSFTNKTDALLFLNSFCDYYGYSLNKNNLTGFKIFTTELQRYYSAIRFVEYSDNYFLIELIVSEQPPY